jgi:DNA (cytosine-5)-methyltransferase 1
MAQSRRREKRLKVVDLFSGVGGLSLGAARAGFNVCGAVDIDPHAMAAHKMNFPEAGHLEEDISKLSGEKLLTKFNIDESDLKGIIGGPPCQGFSSIGRNKKNDPRNKLFVHFFRLVSETKPKFFLAENVPGILNEKNKNIRKSAFAYVEDEYTILPHMALAAHEYGAPTTRTRVFFFGCTAGVAATLTQEDFKPPADVEVVRVGDALAGLPVKVHPDWQTEEKSWRVVDAVGDSNFALRLHGHIPPGVGDLNAIERLNTKNEVSGFLGTFHSKRVAKRYAMVKHGMYDSVSKSRKLNPQGFCPTLRAGTGVDHGSYQAVRPLHPTEARVITPREAARMQGFPDWFQFSPTKWHSFRQIGNSVSPILAERIFVVIKKALI